jgi:predicted CopG family antitoxin
MSFKLNVGNISSSNNLNILTNSSSKAIIGESKIILSDPSDTFDTLSSHSVWDTITSKGVSLKETLDALSDEINTLRKENKLMKLDLLALKGTFNQEEISNIKKMIMSEDEAARTLADSIIQNA